MPFPRSSSQGVLPFAQQTSQTCLVDGAAVTLCSKPLPRALHSAAARAGFDLVSRTDHKDWLLIRCRTCGAVSLRRRNVVRDHRPECHHCIRDRRVEAAAIIGATLIGADPDHRHYGLFRLACGHIVRRQYLRVEHAAGGGHAAGCGACREARYAEEAKAQGWTLVGPAVSSRDGYRSYRHRCGQAQDVSVGNMQHGDVDCSGCGESWSSKPSAIYLFRIGLATGTVLKLGYSSNPRRRLRQQLGIAKGTSTKILRVVRMPTGHEAQVEEKAIHALMRRTRPELIVPKPVYGDAINTRTEIYTPQAGTILHERLDAVADRFPGSGAPPD